MASAPPMRTAGAALELLESIYDSASEDELQRRYLAAVPRLVRSQAWGLYFFAEGPRPVSVATESVPASFIEAYEAEGRLADPLLRYIVRNRCAGHERLVRSRTAWSREGVGRVLAAWGLEHSLQAPVVVDGNLVATLNFARAIGTRSFSVHDVARADWLASHLGRIVRQLRGDRRARRLGGVLMPALELMPTAAAVTDEAAGIIDANGQCRRTLLVYRNGGELPAVMAEAVRENVAALALEGGRYAERTVRSERHDVDYLVRTRAGATAGDTFVTVLWPVVDSECAAAERLSARERQIVALVAQGASNAQIAERLSVSPNTVKDHLKRVYARLGVRGRVQLARWAQDHLRDA